MDCFEVDLDDSWSIGGKPHGGYLLATMVGLALDEAHPHPLAVSAHYVSSPDAGAASVEVERLRAGRSVASSRLRLVQSGRPRVEVLLTAGRLTASSPYWGGSPAPVLPPVEECLRAPAEVAGRRVGQLDHVEMRVDASSMRWAVGAPSRQLEHRAYLRRDDGDDPSLLDLLVFADTLPPVTFDLGLMGWVPTVELTVLVRALPAPGWVTAVQRSRLLQDGWLDEECTLWDSDGRLVVQARQLAGYRES
ncbi:MAG: thioesterase family protein [Actinobacteria bacterium]|nr:thioesterase family protein [Actinomycetota bacterium]MCA1722421.1 thioesterase family protein [Actinomycetota bacterium]